MMLVQLQGNSPVQSKGIENLHYRIIFRLYSANKLSQVCKQVVTNLFTGCQQVVLALLIPSLFATSCYQLVTTALSDLSQGCSNKSDAVMM